MQKQLTPFMMKLLPDGKHKKRQWAIKIGDFYLHRDKWIDMFGDETPVIVVSWEGYALLSFPEKQYAEAQSFAQELCRTGMHSELLKIEPYQGNRKDMPKEKARAIRFRLMDAYYRHSNHPRPTAFLEIARDFIQDQS